MCCVLLWYSFFDRYILLSGYFGIKIKETPFVQYLFPVGAGPSSKTWPKCASHLEHKISVLFMNLDLSSSYFTFSVLIEFQKLGHPVPESYFYNIQKIKLSKYYTYYSLDHKSDMDYRSRFKQWLLATST